MTKARDLAQIVSSGVSEAFKNRIINGAMVIDQRNAGASFTNTGNQFVTDRWYNQTSSNSVYTIGQNLNSIATPAGFSNYLGFQVTSPVTVSAGAYYFLSQFIEGFNTADLNFGTANAQTVTLSFWVRSSLTGAFGGSLQNNAQNRVYPFQYTISAANTWEQKSVTITGDTTGTWVGATNGIGLRVNFGLGVGTNWTGPAGAWGTTGLWSANSSVNVVSTNGATFYITGVQLEVGSTATSFDYRPYGTELALCQRYFFIKNSTTGTGFSSTFRSSTRSEFWVQAPSQMRASPTISSSGIWNVGNWASSAVVSSFGINQAGTIMGTYFANHSNLSSSGIAGEMYPDTGGTISFSSEL
jgi:hypothetical protein